MNKSFSVMSGALVVAVLAGSVFAQSQPKKTEEPVLKGPSVKGEGVPGENRQFSTGRVKGKDQMGTEIPHRLFMAAIDGLRGKETAAAVRLTSDQDTKIKAINDEFTATVQKFRTEHQDEVRALLPKLSPEDRRKAMTYLGRAGGLENKRPGVDTKKNISKKDLNAKPEEMTEQAEGTKGGEEAKARLKEMLEMAPNPSDTHTRIFGVLTDPQKKAFQAAMEQAKEGMGDRAGGKAQKKVTDKAPKDAMPEKEMPDNPNIPAKARERLKNMTPEQREEALKRFREKGGKGGEKKAPPSTKDDVMVPDKDEK